MLHTVNVNFFNCGSKMCGVRSMRAGFVFQLVKNTTIEMDDRKPMHFELELRSFINTKKKK